MPKDLPGLYWDPVKNRYFPLSSRPAAAASSPSNPSTSTGTADKLGSPSTSNDTTETGPVSTNISKLELKRKRKLDTLSNLNQRSLNWSWNWAESERIRKCIISSNVANTNRLSQYDLPTFGRATAFCTYPSKLDHPYTGERWHLLGDSLGWLFRCNTSQSILQPDVGGNSNWLPWSTELNLQPSGHVSSMSMSGSRWVATGFGNGPRVVFSDINHLDRMSIITLYQARDLWSSHLFGQELALGASSKGIFLPDLEHSPSPKYLHTDNDVFSVTQNEHLIYTGSRNGTIHRFDKRIGFKHRGQVILEGRFGRQSHHKSKDRRNQRSPVLRLELMASSTSRTLESGLFVSHMNGDLQLFDLRCLSTSDVPVEPAVQYSGHVNSYRKELGLAIDINNDFIYAAGQDCRIRGWCLSSGEPLLPAPPAPTSIPSSISRSYGRTSGQQNNPFLAVFDDPIEVLQISSGSYERDAAGEFAGEERYDGFTDAIEGACLWAANGRDLWKWNLGERMATSNPAL